MVANKSQGRLWTREELILTINLYFRTPFGKIHNRNPSIIALAEKLNRTPSSVVFKMSNFASLDPTLEQKGLENHSKLDKIVWDEFFNNTDLFLENSDQISEKYELSEPSQSQFEYDLLQGIDYLTTTKARRNQSFFRGMILASYNFKCAVTGIDQKELLVASHILPWASNPTARMDPKNGICLNTLYDKAFDRGLVSFSDDYRLILSKKLNTSAYDYFSEFEGKAIALPDRFIPSPEYLSYHRQEIFIE